MTSVAPSLDVVIVSYRCRDLLRSCLSTLLDSPPRGELSVVVVDNDSDDGTVEMARVEFPSVRLVPLEGNRGFAYASNVGLRLGTSPYVLLLNPDTQMRSGVLETLLQLMGERSDVGIAGCRLMRPDGTIDHAGRRSFPTIVGALGHFTGIGRSLNRSALAQYRAPEVERGPVDAVNGAFMLIRRDALDQVGLFDEGYWMYMEDLDLCYRFKAAGWTIWYEPSVSVLHVKHGTTDRPRRPRLQFAFHYGMYRFYRTHYACRRSSVTNAVVYLGIGLKLAVALLYSSLWPRRVYRSRIPSTRAAS